MIGELGAERVTDPSDIKPPRAEELSNRIEAFVTPVGRVDVFREVRRIGGYEDVVASAQAFEVGPGLSILVAGLDDIIWSKSGTGRAKDADHVRSLERLRQELEGDPAG